MEEVVARVYDRYLYREELREILPANLSDIDSAAFVQNYINIWAKDQLMIYKAEYNLNEQQKDFEEQIQSYRNDLLKFTYREKYVEQNLDTAISQSAIEAFYRDHPENFVLRENILQAHYIVVPENAPRLNEAREWFQSDKEEDESVLKDYALQYSRQFSLEDSTWVSYDWLAKQIPQLSGKEQEEFLKTASTVEYQDSMNIYMLKIFDFRLKDEQAPLSYSKKLIRNILLNQRKLDLLAELEKNLLHDAMDKKEFETY